MPFSIIFQVPLILDGRKRQTTRLPRKTPLKVGDVLFCWYKPRQKKTCKNCIIQDCHEAIPDDEKDLTRCKRHTNFFGRAVVDSIISFQCIDGAFLEYWARHDGFENYDHADTWFVEQYGTGWSQLPFQVIEFIPGWVK